MLNIDVSALVHHPHPETVSLIHSTQMCKTKQENEPRHIYYIHDTKMNEWFVVDDLVMPLHSNNHYFVLLSKDDTGIVKVTKPLYDLVSGSGLFRYNIYSEPRYSSFTLATLLLGLTFRLTVGEYGDITFIRNDSRCLLDDGYVLDRFAIHGGKHVEENERITPAFWYAVRAAFEPLISKYELL